MILDQEEQARASHGKAKKERPRGNTLRDGEPDHHHEREDHRCVAYSHSDDAKQGSSERASDGSGHPYVGEIGGGAAPEEVDQRNPCGSDQERQSGHSPKRWEEQQQGREPRRDREVADLEVEGQQQDRSGHDRVCPESRSPPLLRQDEQKQDGEQPIAPPVIEHSERRECVANARRADHQRQSGDGKNGRVCERQA